MWSSDEQDCWDGLRKEARQHEILINQKIALLEAAFQVREEDIALTLVSDSEKIQGTLPPVDVDGGGLASTPASSTLSSSLQPVFLGATGPHSAPPNGWVGYPSRMGNPQTSETFEKNGFNSRHAYNASGLSPASSVETGYVLETWKEKKKGGSISERHEGRRKRPINEIQMDVKRKVEDVYCHLQRFQNTVNQLLDLTRFLPQSHANHHVVQRLQNLLMDKTSTVKQLERDFQRRIKDIQLLPSIRRDMKAFQENAQFHNMLEEQHSLHLSYQRVQRCVDTAESTQSMLREQRERFDAAANALVHLMERVPIIKRTLGRVNQGRRREMVVMGLVIGFCLFLILLFW